MWQVVLGYITPVAHRVTWLIFLSRFLSICIPNAFFVSVSLCLSFCLSLYIIFYVFWKNPFFVGMRTFPRHFDDDVPPIVVEGIQIWWARRTSEHMLGVDTIVKIFGQPFLGHMNHVGGRIVLLEHVHPHLIQGLFTVSSISKLTVYRLWGVVRSRVV